MRDLAGEVEKASADEPCMGVWACHLLYELGLSDDEVNANWRKLAGRPTGQVKGLVALLESERREVWQHHITAFGKSVKSVKEAA